MSKINEVISESIKKYDDIYGERHHDVCDGLKCECHKEVKDHIKQSQIKLLEAVMDEAKNIPTGHLDSTVYVEEFLEKLQESINNIK